MPDESSLQRKIRQTRPFRSPAQEATIAILRTADVLRRHMTRVLEPFGLTLQQYNVLRILRGAHPDPLPTLEIAGRLIEEMPGITRLLDRLEKKALVKRERCVEDRRQVHIRITPAGLAILAKLDAVMNAADERGLEGLAGPHVEALIAALATVRASIRAA